MPKRKRISTETQSFGVSKRESHDSSKFYGRKVYAAPKQVADEDYIENQVPAEYLDRVFCKSSERMDELPESSVHLMVTSPPYNVGKAYDQDLSVHEYRMLLRRVFEETFRVLVQGGRACVNIANIGRKPYIPLHSYVIQEMADIGFLMRGEIIWNKSASSGTSTAWGSWKSATNPTLRDTHEYILVFSKGSYSRIANGREDTISREDFLTFTKSVWEFPAESARRVGHPAPFPVELPHRCIQLYSFRGDVVLDPFCGVGTSCVAAASDGRRYVGYETNPQYVELAMRRLQR
ncbi:MAG TPA: site-specific DNA-methyltransferase [Nitrososphaera sp.]|nr:site-specific DNA-methyltransferase [Nitrososphaera sp.]